MVTIGEYSKCLSYRLLRINSNFSLNSILIGQSKTSFLPKYVSLMNIIQLNIATVLNLIFVYNLENYQIFDRKCHILVILASVMCVLDNV